MDAPPTVVVLGATGSVGGQVVAQLGATGVAVRAVGRDAQLAMAEHPEPTTAEMQRLLGRPARS